MGLGWLRRPAAEVIAANNWSVYRHNLGPPLGAAKLEINAAVFHHALANRGGATLNPSRWEMLVEGKPNVEMFFEPSIGDNRKTTSPIPLAFGHRFQHRRALQIPLEQKRFILKSGNIFEPSIS